MSASAFGVEHTISKGGINPFAASGKTMPVSQLGARLHAERAAQKKPGKFKMKTAEVNRINRKK